MGERTEGQQRRIRARVLTETVAGTSGPADLMPLWICGTTTDFSGAESHFLHGDVEEDDNRVRRPARRRHARAEVARLLLPAEHVAAALIQEQR